MARPKAMLLRPSSDGSPSCTAATAVRRAGSERRRQGGEGVLGFRRSGMVRPSARPQACAAIRKCACHDRTRTWCGNPDRAPGSEPAYKSRLREGIARAFRSRYGGVRWAGRRTPSHRTTSRDAGPEPWRRHAIADPRHFIAKTIAKTSVLARSQRGENQTFY